MAGLIASVYLSTLLCGSIQVSEITPVAGFQLFCYLWNPITVDSITNTINGIISTVSLIRDPCLPWNFLFKWLRSGLRHNRLAMTAQLNTNFEKKIEQPLNYSGLYTYEDITNYWIKTYCPQTIICHSEPIFNLSWRSKYRKSTVANLIYCS